MQSFLVYSPANSNIASNIAANLKLAGVNTTHDTRRLANRIEEYKLFSTNSSDPIILLISDNFLKDKECMYEALNFLQNPSLKNRVHPIITDGRTEDALGGVNYTTTKFERVSNVIHYMNFWQDQYLEMRKLKRDSKIENEEEFNNDLQIIRAISSEIGEFLRILRGTSYSEFDTLADTKYESLFRKAGWNNAFAAVRDKQFIPFEKEDSTDPGIDINSIPGINLIKEEVQEVEVVETPKIINEIKEEVVIDTKEELEVLSKEIEVPEIEVKDEIIESITSNVDEVLSDANSIEGSNLLEKVSDYKNNIEEKIEEEIEVVNTTVEEVVDSKDEILEETILGVNNIEETSIEEKEAFEKEGLSYQDKSSYDLLISLFEDDTNVETEVETTEEENNFIKDTFNTETPEVEDIQKEAQEEFSVNIPVEPDTNLEIESITEEIEAIKEELANQPQTHDVEAIKTIIAEGDTLEAMKMLKEVLTVQPENTEARFEYAMILSDEIKNYKEAKEQLKTVVSLEENHIEATLRLAELYEVDEEYIQVKQCFEQALEIQEDYPGLQHKYAALLNNNFKAHKKTALKHYKIAVEQDEKNIDALYQLAVMQHEYSGKTKKALKKFQQVIQMEPTHPFANYDIAVIYYEMDKPKLAAQYYYDAYQNNPELRTKKNDEAFKVDKYLFAPQEERVDEVLETKDEVLEEILIDDLSDLTGTYELTEVETPVLESTSLTNSEDIIDDSIKEPNIAFKKIEELLEEDDSFEDLEDLENNTGDILEELESINEELVEESEIQDDIIEEESELVHGVVASNVVDTHLIVPDTEKEEITESPNKPSTLVLITGATSGIGKASAYQFAKNGHNMIITGRRAGRLAEIKVELEGKYSVSVETLEFDVRNLDACKKAMDSLDERFKNVDILLNNAGLAKGKSPIHEGDLDHWDTMIDTNIKGLLYMTRLVAPGMVARGKGHIINIGSIAGKEVYPNGNVYCATKHAVDALTKGMRIDLHKYNIRVSTIHPGAVEDTEFSMVRHDFDESKARDYQDFTPVNANDIAEIVHFVATRPAHVNIQDLLVMGTQQATATISDNTGRK